MSEINNVLSTWTFSDKNIERIEKCIAPAKLITVHKTNYEMIGKALQYVDVAFLWNDIDERYINAPNLKWIQFAQAGLEKSLCSKVFEKNMKITSGAGCSIVTLSEHAMFFLLALSYNSIKLYNNQKNKIWEQSVLASQKCLNGKTLGIIGYGNIGRKVAEVAKGFGMNIIAYNRSAVEKDSIFNRIYCAENKEVMDEVLEQSDYVLLSTNLTKETYHMIGKAEFKKMKNSTCIINVSRGSVIDEEAMIQALNESEIAGAALDTTEVEPLPSDSPLWEMDNVILTPHWSPLDELLEDKLIDVLEENVKRYKNNQTLINQLSERDIFKE